MARARKACITSQSARSRVFFLFFSSLKPAPLPCSRALTACVRSYLLCDKAHTAALRCQWVSPFSTSNSVVRETADFWRVFEDPVPACYQSLPRRAAAARILSTRCHHAIVPSQPGFPSRPRRSTPLHSKCSADHFTLHGLRPSLADAPSAGGDWLAAVAFCGLVHSPLSEQRPATFGAWIARHRCRTPTVSSKAGEHTLCRT